MLNGVAHLPTGTPPFSHDEALCRGVDPAVFYPELPNDRKKGPAAERAFYAEALALCTPCPARSACLDHAIATDERHGMWGGMTRRERLAEADRRKGGNGLRRCSACDDLLPVAAFGQWREGRLRNRCRPCQAEYERPIAVAYRSRKAERAERPQRSEAASA